MPPELYMTNEEMEHMGPELSESLLYATKGVWEGVDVIPGKEWLRGGSKDRDSRKENWTERDERMEQYRDELVKKYDLAGYVTNPDIMSLVSTIFEPPTDGTSRMLVTDNEILRKVFKAEKEEHGLENVQCFRFGEVILDAREQDDPETRNQPGNYGMARKYLDGKSGLMMDKLTDLEIERSEGMYKDFDKNMKDRGQQFWVQDFKPYQTKEYEKAQRKQEKAFVSAEFRAAKSEAVGMDQQRTEHKKGLGHYFKSFGKNIAKGFKKVFGGGSKKKRSAPEMDI